MAKRGGIRKNAGRKKVPENLKKLPKHIYFPSYLIEEIDNLKIKNCQSFSSKATMLIEEGIKNMAKNDHSVTKKIRIADLFAGMGGIRIGFEKALEKKGMVGETVFVSEIKKSAVKVYEDNFPGHSITGDITKVDAKDIPDIDYLLAGFPCQAFSHAGKRLGFDDTRGTLFFDVARIIKEKQPKGFLLENVEGLTTHDHGKTFTVILNVLNDLGYQVSYKILNATDFGLAQARKRIYIIGTKNGSKPDLNFSDIYEPSTFGDVIEENIPAIHDDFSEKILNNFSLKEIEGKQIKDKRGGKNNIHSWDFSLKGEVSQNQKILLDLLLKQRRNKKWADIIGIDWMDGMPLTVDMISTFYSGDHLQEMLDDLVKKGYLTFEHPKKKTLTGREYDKTKPKGYNIVTGKLSFEYNRILSRNDVVPTLVATDLSHLGVPVADGIRPITTRECLRLFGYPENYSLDAVTTPKAYDLLGNTVVVTVIEKVAERLLEAAK